MTTNARFIGKVEATITTQNTFSDPLWMRKGDLSFILRGITSSVVHLQRSIDNKVTWDDVGGPAGYTMDGFYGGTEPHYGAWWRFGIKTGNMGSQESVVGIISY